MKHRILFILCLTLSLGAMAQHKHHQEGRHQQPDVTKMVSDLTTKQKQQLDEISKQSKDAMHILHKQQRALRDSIDRYMQMEGDQSDKLFPLFDQEAKVQANISREMYTTRIKLDKVLTPSQRAEMKAALEKENGNKKKMDRSALKDERLKSTPVDPQKPNGELPSPKRNKKK